MTRNPELIVPIRDRRRGKRILTLKNARNVTLVALGLFVALMIVSEVRGPKMHEDYGRLFGEQVAAPAPEVKKSGPEIVTEAPIADADHADPMLLSAAAREQYLGVTPATAFQRPITETEVPAPPAATVGDHVTLVGDSNGVTVVKSETPQRGVLGGGIFKQP